MCHVNFAFAKDGRIVQSVPFTPEHVVTRTVIPGHVTPNPDYLALLDALAADPARMQRLERTRALRSRAGLLHQGAAPRRRRPRPFPDAAARGRRLRDRLGPGGHAAYDPLGSRQQRPARRRLRDARDLRAGGLSRREAQGQRAIAGGRRRRRRSSRGSTMSMRNMRRPRPRPSRAIKNERDPQTPHRRDRQQHGRSRHLCESHARKGRDRRGAELRDGPWRKGRQSGGRRGQARRGRRHGDQGRRRHVRRQYHPQSRELRRRHETCPAA